MIRSMTGFSRVSGAISNRYHVSITTKSVNHRYLELSVRLPEFLWEVEQSIRSLAGEVMSRGKVDVSVRVQRTADADYTARVNTRVADAVIPQLRNLMEDRGIAAHFTAADLLRIPDLLDVEAIESELTDEEQEGLRSLARQAFDRLVETRTAEGRRLEEDIDARLTRVAELRDEVDAQRAAITAELAEQYRARLAEIMGMVEGKVTEERVAQELVLLAEKADVAEELTRMTIHLEAARKLFTAKEAAGKKLDFLAQELLREINTLGQKSRAAAIRSAVVELKTEVERVREQVQNVE